MNNIRIIPVALSIMLSCCCISLNAKDNHTTTQYPYDISDLLADAGASENYEYTEAEVQERILKMKSPIVTMKYTAAVSSYVKTYSLLKRDRTEWMLGRTVMFFPIFEKYLKERGLPSELKYLSVVESALNPAAVSRSGAVGLWQFMPPTGKEYGLDITYAMDERKDPHKSTQAALTYLTRLYKRFGNWELALAAYNGGPGRVNRAIKRGRSKNFWRIKKYLPRETRNYIPAFIGATYILNHYDKHQLTPVYPEPDLQITESIKVYKAMNFQEIADVTGAPYKVIEVLNPAYKRKSIPQSREGNYVILPEYAMGPFFNFLGRPDTRKKPSMAGSSLITGTAIESDPNYYKTTYIVNIDDDIYSIANKFKCEANDIKNWNYLTSPSMIPGTKLILYMPKTRNKWTEFARLPSKEFSLAEAEIDPIQAKDIQLLPQPEPVKFSFFKSNKKDKRVYYQVRRRETLMDITKKFPDVEVEEILKLNRINNPEAVKPGMRLLIKNK